MKEEDRNRVCGRAVRPREDTQPEAGGTVKGIIEMRFGVIL